MLVAVLGLTATTPSAEGASDRHPVAQLAADALGRTEGTFAMIVRFRVSPGQEAAFVAAMAEPLVETVKEAGNRQYALHGVPGKPGEYVLLERWVDVAALDEHLKQPYLVRLGEALGGLLAEDPAIDFLTPVEP